jgi:alpha-glucosidase
MNYVSEKPADPLTLLLHPAEGSGEATLYEDAGDGFGYERGEYARRRVICEVSETGALVSLSKREGSFVPERSSMNLELRRVSTRPDNVLANGQEAEWSYEEADRKLLVRLEEHVGEAVVEVHV